MKRQLSTVVFLLIGFLVTGCATTPKGKVSQLWDGYAGVTGVAAQLRSSGQITAIESATYVLPAKAAVRKQIQAAEDGADAGIDPTSEQALITQAQTGLSSFQTWLATKQAKK